MPFTDYKLRALAAALAAGGLAAALLSGCGDANSKAAPAAEGAPITAAVVVERSVTPTQEFSGRLESIERVDIRARVGGFITAVNIQPGGKVKRARCCS